jgi:hypothetical protein
MKPSQKPVRSRQQAELYFSTLKMELASFLPASRWFLAWLTVRRSRWRWHITPKRRLTFNGLHGVISQKTVLFVTTAVRTSVDFFDPEDGGNIFLRNVGWHWTDYMALYPRRWYSSILFSYLCYCGTFFHHITYVNRPKYTNTVFSQFGLFI